MDENHLEAADALTTSVIEAGIARARVKQAMPEGFDGFCNCGAEIPLARIEQSRYNCVHCQSAIERRNKFFTTGGKTPS